jgi:hypothetical protein
MDHTFHIPVELQHYLKLTTWTIFPPGISQPPQPSRRASNRTPVTMTDSGFETLSGEFRHSGSSLSSLCKHIVTMLGGPLFTTAWRVLMLRMEETASRDGGELQIY